MVVPSDPCAGSLHSPCTASCMFSLEPCTGSWRRLADSMSCTLADSWIGQLQKGKRKLSLQPSGNHRDKVLIGCLSALE